MVYYGSHPRKLCHIDRLRNIDDECVLLGVQTQLVGEQRHWMVRRRRIFFRRRIQALVDRHQLRRHILLFGVEPFSVHIVAVRDVEAYNAEGIVQCRAQIADLPIVRRVEYLVPAARQECRIYRPDRGAHRPAEGKEPPAAQEGGKRLRYPPVEIDSENHSAIWYSRPCTVSPARA